MGKNNRAKKAKTNQTVQISQHSLNMWKAKTEAMVTKRCFVLAIAAFWDEADLHWREYFKSKKKMEEFRLLAIRTIQQYDGYIDESKVVKFDYIADEVYKKTGFDMRTYWVDCNKYERMLDEARIKNQIKENR